MLGKRKPFFKTFDIFHRLCLGTQQFYVANMIKPDISDIIESIKITYQIIMAVSCYHLIGIKCESFGFARRIHSDSTMLQIIEFRPPKTNLTMALYSLIKYFDRIENLRICRNGFRKTLYMLHADRKMLA